jgi:hypothetical protein
MESKVTGARPFYDLTNPIVFAKDEGVIKEIEGEKIGQNMLKVGTREAVLVGKDKSELSPFSEWTKI